MNRPLVIFVIALIVNGKPSASIGIEVQRRDVKKVGIAGVTVSKRKGTKNSGELSKV